MSEYSLFKAAIIVSAAFCVYQVFLLQQFPKYSQSPSNSLTIIDDLNIALISWDLWRIKCICNGIF